MLDQHATAAAPQTATNAISKKEVYTMHQITKLRGYTGLNWNKRLPEFWYQALTTREENEHRRMLSDRVVQWMKENGHGVVTHGLYFTKGQIEDIIKAKFSTPNGAQGVLTGHLRASPLLGFSSGRQRRKLQSATQRKTRRRHVTPST